MYDFVSCRTYNNATTFIRRDRTSFIRDLFEKEKALVTNRKQKNTNSYLIATLYRNQKKLSTYRSEVITGIRDNFLRRNEHDRCVYILCRKQSGLPWTRTSHHLNDPAKSFIQRQSTTELFYIFISLSATYETSFSLSFSISIPAPLYLSPALSPQFSTFSETTRKTNVRIPNENRLLR